MTCYRSNYFDATGTVTNYIKTRFAQPGSRALKKHSATYFKCYKWVLKYQNQLEVVLSDYGEKINHYRLPAQPQILKNKFADSNEKTFEKNF